MDQYAFDEKLKKTKKFLKENKVTSTHDTLFGKRHHLLVFRIFCILFFIVEWTFLLMYLNIEDADKILAALTVWGIMTTPLYFAFVIIDDKCK